MNSQQQNEENQDLVQQEPSKPVIKSRKFLGKVTNFDSKEEQRFEQKHLKAYIKGHERFTFGKEDVINSKGIKVGERPKWHDVKQEFIF